MEQNKMLFTKKNYKVMLLGLCIIALGFILMSGGGDDNPDHFDESVYSIVRIGIAPALVIIGFAVEAWAIFLQDKNKK